jgi:hypothetical protein
MSAQWSTKRGGDLEEDLAILLGDVCVNWGYCNRLSAADLIAHGPHLNGDIFADAILRAEGHNPEMEGTMHRRLKRLFTDRYGSGVSALTYLPGV